MSKSESGAVMVLVALLCVAIMMMVGLAIDTSVLATSKTSHEHTTDMVALAAIEAFSSADPTDPAISSIPARIELAVSRATRLAEKNLKTWIAQSYMPDSEQPTALFGMANARNNAFSGPNGTITAGYWFFDKPESCATTTGTEVGLLDWMIRDSNNNCPCDFDPDLEGVDEDGWKGGCFVEVNGNDVNDEVVVNAFRVDMRTKDSSSIEGTFTRAKDGNPPRFQVSSSAIAALIPRNVLIAIDISPSLASETHDSFFSDDPALFGEYTFQVAHSDENGDFRRPNNNYPRLVYTFNTDFSEVETGVSNPAVSDGGPFNYDLGEIFGCLNEGWGRSGNRDIFFSNGTIDGVERSDRCRDWFSQAPPRRQYDYARVGIQNTTDGLSGGFGDPRFWNAEFLIDTSSDPEPLRSVLMGVHEAMDAFQESSIGADQIGFTAFDDDILLKRSTASPSSSQPGLVRTTSESFEEFLRATDYDTEKAEHPVPRGASPTVKGEIMLERLNIQKMLFPRFYSGQSYKTNRVNPVTQSDLNGVMRRTRGIISDVPNAENATSSVIMFTDGMASCNRGGQCDVANELYHRDAIRGIIEQAETDFREQGIAFHVFLIGKDVAPHTMVLGNGSGNPCMTDDEARRRDASGEDTDFVDSTGGSLEGRSSSSPYYYPNKLYEATRVTGGGWVPVRPPCQEVGGESFQDYLDSQCSAGVPVGETLDLESGPNPAVLDDDGNQIYPQSLVDGRLLCDPYGRTVSEQVEQEMTKVVLESPFVLVSEKPAQ